VENTTAASSINSMETVFEIGVGPLNWCYAFLVPVKRWPWEYSTTLFA